ncbi:MAG: hypothetical protein A3I71_01615 [Omnitrophica WOR_2 bacterium RIFCSPLOWO2_02_FULL_63_16]|nr:MAG: hypothetical protein A3I71_01615 [Omnitrophica WOR_2 bacterium RIFCSPLOWO2_02_FULL_63_16]OGX48719.1 MAG: hypothetical protein A3G88_05840 [Omnitrophica WOR_2 bacterium RIFCSPLOWO2_12_FULL_63_16]
MQLLIVGANGLLGRSTAAAFRAAGVPVLCASHQAGSEVRINFEEPLGDWAARLPEGITHALVCSSLTNIDACARNPQLSRRFNVTRTTECLEGLLDENIEPIFCSSDLVFAGDRGDYREEDPREPTTEYGRQKKAVEDVLLGERRPWLILRLSKLYSLEPDDPSPVGQTLTAFSQERHVRAADDQVVCPTWAGDIPRTLHALLTRQAAGVFHVTAPEPFTRYALALRLAHAVGKPHLVERCSIRDFTFSEPRPVNNSLNVERTLTTTGMRFMTLEEALPQILGRRKPATVASSLGVGS